MERNTVVTGEAVAKAVNAGNALREAFGGEPLERLPEVGPGAQGDARRCVLAKAFNFDCRVAPVMFFRTRSPLSLEQAEQLCGAESELSVWAVELRSREHADQLAHVLEDDGVRTLHIEGDEERGIRARSYVTLPDEVAAIARAFDGGLLDDQLEDLERAGA